jgi:hypothetical protein|tara:strand:+ start:129 stop:593 length:465 start_codon:yes stop_codon:yes gene_type:complete
MATRPFFVPQKEIDLIDSFNEELIDNILSQYVDIYKVSVENTEENLYGESSTKYFDKGFRVNCLISFEEPTIEQNDFGPDMNANLELYFHRTTLKDENFYPEMGDIVDWNDIYWEINAVTEPQLIAGHQAFKHMIKAVANRARLSGLQIEERPR